MEYVDGEDLASLLRRIGRFPRGQRASSSRGSSAPASPPRTSAASSIAISSRPTSCSTAAAGSASPTSASRASPAKTLRAGTPAYMAPEQLAGGEVTPRSDIYALGLVLYELFTGRRALEGATLAELIAQARAGRHHAAHRRSCATSIPAIERAIMRCLEPDPAQRPASALAVAAALPGGDPLAAALAAGETPSPEMVAAAGDDERAAAAAGALRGLARRARAGARVGRRSPIASLVTSLVPLPKPPRPARRARQGDSRVARLPAGSRLRARVRAGELSSATLTSHPGARHAERLRERHIRRRCTSGIAAARRRWCRACDKRPA